MQNLLHTEQYRGYTINIHPDHDADSPREGFTNLCVFVGANGDYDDLTEEGALFPTGTPRKEIDRHPDVVSTIGVYLDGTMVATAYITKKAATQCGCPTQALYDESVMFTDWARGCVYAYEVLDSRQRHVESCCGFYPPTDQGDAPFQYGLDDAKAHIDGMLEERARKYTHLMANA